MNLRTNGERSFQKVGGDATAWLTVGVFALCVLCSARVTATELVVNGGFETGTLVGWTVTGGGAWNINNGTYDPQGPSTPLAPISGSFDAVGDQTGPSLTLLSSSILLPSVITSASLSWMDRIQNWATTFDANQRFAVSIIDASNTVHQIFSTMPGDNAQQLGPNARSFDVTALLQSLAGQTINLQFADQATYFYNTITVDNISLQVSGQSVPDAGSSALLLILSLMGLGFVGCVQSRRSQLVLRHC
jgi:hypothetical protein